MVKSKEIEELEKRLMDNSDGFWTKLFNRLINLPSPRTYEDKIYEWKLNGKK